MCFICVDECPNCNYTIWKTEKGEVVQHECTEVCSACAETASMNDLDLKEGPQNADGDNRAAQKLVAIINGDSTKNRTSPYDIVFVPQGDVKKFKHAQNVLRNKNETENEDEETKGLREVWRTATRRMKLWNFS